MANRKSSENTIAVDTQNIVSENSQNAVKRYQIRSKPVKRIKAIALMISLEVISSQIRQMQKEKIKIKEISRQNSNGCATRRK